MPSIDSGAAAAVVFDLDGVLLDTTENMRVALTAAWRAAGRSTPVPFEEFLTHMGAPLPQILRAFDLPAWAETVYAEASAGRIDLVRAFPGVAEMLRSLRAAGVPIAVATGKARRRADQALEAGRLTGSVDVVVGSDQVRRPKPHPESLHTAVAELGAIGHATMSTTEVVFIGDSVLDMRCGRSAGAHVIAAGWGQTDAGTLLAERPDGFAAQPSDLLAALLPTTPPPPGRAALRKVRR